MPVAVAVDQVDDAAADALDRRDVQFHGSDPVRDGRGAEIAGAPEGRRGVMDAETHRAGRRAVQLREALAESVGLGIDDEIDVALLVQRDVLAAMAGHHREAHALEQRAQQDRIGRGVLDELEAVGAHRIVEKLGHARSPDNSFQLKL